MNTDNTTISGETIDHGPCAFIDAYDPKAVFSSTTNTDAIPGNQPPIMQWNLSRFAETLIDLVNPGRQGRRRSPVDERDQCVPSPLPDALVEGDAGQAGLLKNCLAIWNWPTILSAAKIKGGITQACFGPWCLCARQRHVSACPFADPAGFDAWVDRYLSRTRDEVIPETARADLMDQGESDIYPAQPSGRCGFIGGGRGDMAPFDRLLGSDSAFQARGGSGGLCPPRAQ